MKRPSPVFLIVLLLAVAFKLAEQPLIKALALCAVIAVIGVAVRRPLTGWPPVRRLATRLRFGAFGWFIPALLALAAVGTLLATQPHLRATYTPDGFATARDIDSQRGFYATEQDAAGNRYVWTQDRATVVFDFLVHKPVTFTFAVRSAAVAGGSPDPVRVLINGEDAGALRPDPANPAFQSLALRVIPHDWGGQQTEVKLLPTTFKPPGDNRTLGTMVQSIAVDKTEAWSSVARRRWLVWAAAALVMIAAASCWAARRYTSPLAANGAVAANLIGLACAVTIITLVVRIGFIERDAYLVWLLGSAGLGLCFAAGAMVVPIREGRSLFQWMRARLAAGRIPRLWATARAIARSPIDEPPPTRRLILRDLVLVFVVALGVRLVWAVVMPPWQAPDEPDHFIYAAHIVEQAEIPHPPYAPYPIYPLEDLSSWNLTLLYGISSVGAAQDHALPFVPISYDYQAARDYRAPDADRRSSAGGRATSYPPLYYLYSALPYWLFKGAPILTRLFAVRCGSALLGALSCLFGYLLAFELRRSRRWGRALGLCMALLPMYAFITATVNNDAAMNLCTTALIWLTVRTYRRAEPSLRLAMALGVASGLALLAKPTVFPVVAVAGVVALIKLVPAFRASWQSAQARLLAFGAYAAGGIALYGPWALFRLHYYGDVGFGTIPLAPLLRFMTGDATVAASPLSPVGGTLPPSSPWFSVAAIPLGQFLRLTKDRGWQYFFDLLIRNFWGNFGWLDAPLSERVFTPIIVVYLIGGIGLLVQLALQPRRRADLLLLLGFLFAMALFLFIGVDYYQGYVRSGAEVGLQGRYFFPILAPFLFLLLSGWDHLCGENGLALRLAPVGMLCLQLIGLATVLLRYYGVAIG